MRDDVFIPFWLASSLVVAFFIAGFLFGVLYANWGVICR